MTGRTAARVAEVTARAQTRRNIGTVLSVSGVVASVDLGERTTFATFPASLAVAPGAEVQLRVDEVSTIEAILTGPDKGSYWVGKPPGAVSLSADVYRSVDMSSFLRGSGTGPDFQPVFDGHRVLPPFAGHWRVHFEAQFDNSSTSGNRLVGLLKNASGTTYSSTTAPDTATRVKWSKQPAGSDFVTVQVETRLWLDTADHVMPIVRSTAAHALDTNAWETALSLELIRTAP